MILIIFKQTLIKIERTTWRNRKDDLEKSKGRFGEIERTTWRNRKDDLEGMKFKEFRDGGEFLF